jgi:integrase
MHNNFTLFKRVIPGGKKVFYYYAYDGDGERRGPWSTKCTTKTAARNFCHELLKKGALLPDRNKVLTFGEYAKGFWERGSEYVKNQDSRADITDYYIEKSEKMTANQIVPFFGNMPLDKITDKDINDWLLGFRERKIEKDGKTETVSYKNTYANTVFGALNIMMGEAVRRGLLTANPCNKVRRLKNDRKEIKILTVDEVHKLFPDDYKTVWGDKTVAYAANRLASLTGMRIGEIMGLRGEYVFDNHIYICGQYWGGSYKPYTKTKENRSIPLIPEMIEVLRELMKSNGNGYVFSLEGGARPVCQSYVRRMLYRALVKIGLSETEIKQRALSMHGWRHFVNTDLQRQGLTVQQVQGVTGHKTLEMTERYSHLDAMQITEVLKAQSVIAGTKQTENDAKGENELKIVKMPVRKSA